MLETCKKTGHPMTPQNVTKDGKCKRCRQLSQNRWYARKQGAPLCENGHGLIGAGLTAEGVCAECRVEVGIAAPPPPDTWLDWCAVYQALQGRPLIRPLSMYETLCAAYTVRRRNYWTRTETGDWLRENTFVDFPKDNGAFLELRFAPRHGLPLLTVSEAITYENRPDAYVAACAGEPLELEDDAA